MKSPKARKYKDDKISELFDEYGAFFAFSEKQFNEAKDDDVKKYVNLGAGLIAPKENVLEIVNAVDEIVEQAIEFDKAESTDRAIVEYELRNHEAHISRTIQPTVDALDGYGINDEFIKEVYKDIYPSAPIA